MKNYSKIRRLNEHDNSAEWQNNPEISQVLTMTVDSFLDKMKAVDPQKYSELENFIKTNQSTLIPGEISPSNLPAVAEPSQNGDLQAQVDQLKAEVEDLKSKLGASGQAATDSTPPIDSSSDIDMPVEEVPNFNQAVNQGMF